MIPTYLNFKGVQMKYCKKCVMPDTRPGITFDSDGVCMPCKNHERKQKVDYEARFEEFKKLCDKYRGCNGDSWDCAIAVSGGKDSYMLVHVMREKMGMNPLLLFVDDNLSVTEAGKHNLLNLSEEFGCHLIRFNLDRRLNKLITRKTFEKYGKPMWLVEQLIGTYPVHMALRFNISLLVYAENMSYEYGGFGAKETYSAKNLLQDSAVGDIATQLIDDNIKKQDFGFILPPPPVRTRKA
ncbi:hypothetical protein HCCG_01100 [Helicobacter cinaedi CCUG 18818 = ATCC BAA-847]|uniref:N-acetyl sugar amidotransferase n=2 Tax=Helicobacter cinaedi TaxID=213 RepID=A0ABN0BAF9_9HELI|nr:hypothetical protein HCCG_01100 [Helicobacter cinaedi CCUG 18818 = ATCC BAA-847]